MASEENIARQESILLPVLIIALGGAIAGEFYTLAFIASGLRFLFQPQDTVDLWFLVIPLFGGIAMGMAMSLALTRAGLLLRRNHTLQLIVIWALGSGTILLILIPLFGPLANVLAIPITFILPFIAGWLTGRGTNTTIERALGFRHHRLFLPLIWAAGFELFFLACLMLTLNAWAIFGLTGFIAGGLAAGISGWLMLRDLESALRRHSSMKSRNTLEAGEHGALEVVSTPEETLKSKPKAKRRVDIPVPETPRQWRMVTLAGLLVFVLVAAFFLIVPVRTVTVFVTPPPSPTVVPYPTPPMVSLQGTQMIFPPPTQPLPDVDPPPLYFIGQKVQVANLTPDIANYPDWWVSRYQWLPEEREWIYEVVTFDNITIMRAEDQLAPLPTPSALPLPSPTPTIPIRLT